MMTLFGTFRGDAAFVAQAGRQDFASLFAAYFFGIAVLYALVKEPCCPHVALFFAIGFKPTLVMQAGLQRVFRIETTLIFASAGGET